MGKRARYGPGTFCWTDPAMMDPEGVKAFYDALIGWEAEETPAGEAGTYNMLKVDGDEVCAL